eukprot:2283896-Pyramimonas_sp.AAC.2
MLPGYACTLTSGTKSHLHQADGQQGFLRLRVDQQVGRSKDQGTIITAGKTAQSGDPTVKDLPYLEQFELWGKYRTTAGRALYEALKGGLAGHVGQREGRGVDLAVDSLLFLRYWFGMFVLASTSCVIL